MKLSKGSFPVSVKLTEIFRENKKSEIFPLVSPRTLSHGDLETEGLPVEELLSPKVGAVDFGPRSDHEEQGDSDSD